ncbi:MAG: hypothetical protein QMD09_12990, partial [Desulfatibacillaceae bacterium]|nr:hypothetical protein [Desulfatibacillaceae bacterium]
MPSDIHYLPDFLAQPTGCHSKRLKAMQGNGDICFPALPGLNKDKKMLGEPCALRKNHPTYAIVFLGAPLFFAPLAACFFHI